ncbi:MAG: quinone-dependent dihydroorotate dehydrogenase [Bdellovibrionota bacterium]
MLDWGRKALLCLDPELAHSLGMHSLQVLHRTGLLKLLSPRVPELPVEVFGIRFRNPVGLGAGFDKDAECIDALADLGFGFVEAGTVTPRPQPGNPRPRLFRLKDRGALINRMGFNNCGIEQFIRNLRLSKRKTVVGINIGKNATTPIEEAAADYLACLRLAYEHAEYVAVNISSPNTVGLRTLQSRESLIPLLDTLKLEQGALASKFGFYRPLVVKIAPDLIDDDVRSLAETIKNCGIDGVIATNTAIDRSSIGGHPLASEPGGLSGSPLKSRSLAVVKILRAELGSQIPIIASGGLSTAADARDAVAAGARLVQVYTGFVYRGPAVISDLVSGCGELGTTMD